MFSFLTFIAILQSFSISLGVGSSTLAIVSFFVAFGDGNFEPAERKMMNVIYVVLRVSMILILLTTLTLLLSQYFLTSSLLFTMYVIAQFITVGMLFVNALLMSIHKMPRSLGPAIQAGSWYTLGTLAALLPLGLVHFSMTQFLLGYVTWLVLMIALVNGVMAILKHKRKAV